MSTLNPVQKLHRGMDDRFSSANFLRRSFNKVFPDHWSFLLGEIALYTFIVLLLSGTYLTLFFDPSQSETIYNGSYAPLKGVEMSHAFASTLHISFDVRAGLVFRQIHHWAALLFVGSIIIHLMRVFFTGAFRKPRETNWLIGSILLILALVEGFAGYSLPDDLLSGTGLRIMYSVIESVPIVGTWLAMLIFGGEFPGDSIIPRLYVTHILLVPGILLALISAHLGIMWHQKHTQFAGPGRTEHNVVGHRMFPHFAAKSGGFFMLVFGMCAALGGLAQINGVWAYGPYDPSQVTAASQPDFYIGFLDGSTRLFMPWEFRGAGVSLSPLFWPTVVMPGLLFTALMLYPWIEAKITGDRDFHNLLERPRDNPTRTGIGAMALAFYAVLMISGGNDVIATTFNISLNAMTWGGRFAGVVLPPVAFYITRRICYALQAKDRELEQHGVETGIIRQLPSGEFVEVTIPKPLPAHIDLTPVEADNVTSHEVSDHGLLKKGARAVSGFFVERGDEADSRTPEEHAGRRS
jgi:ubiquinol-cytochrome c reductase cytochrome b subunit